MGRQSAEMPPTRRFATKLQRSVSRGVVNVIPGKTGEYFRWFMAQFAADDLTYIGAPVRCEGHTMGSLCGMYSGGDGEGPGIEVKQMLERAAARMSAVMEEL